MSEEFKQTALRLTKARIGITSNVRDELLLATVGSVIDELENEKGIALNAESDAHLMFVVDYATWRYQSVAEKGVGGGLSMPRHLQFRLHNLIISSSRGDSIV